MLDETVLETFLRRGEYVYAKNSWLSGKNAERAQEIGITPKKKAYIRKNVKWSKAKEYKAGMSANQRANILVFKGALAEVRNELGIDDPVKAARIAFGEAAPRKPVSRAKPISVLKAEIENEINKLPDEVRKLYNEKMAAVKARIEAYKRQGTGR